MIGDSGLIPLGPMARVAHVRTKWLQEEAAAGRIPHLNAGGKMLFDQNVVMSELLGRAGGAVQAAQPRSLSKGRFQVKIDRLDETGRLVSSHFCEGEYDDSAGSKQCIYSAKVMAQTVSECVAAHGMWDDPSSEDTLLQLMRYMPSSRDDGFVALARELAEAVMRHTGKVDLADCIRVVIDEEKLGLRRGEGGAS